MIVEWVPEGRTEHYCSRRCALVVVVHDLWEPCSVENFIHVSGFGQIHLEKVSVIIVPSVFLVQFRNVCKTTL